MYDELIIQSIVLFLKLILMLWNILKFENEVNNIIL